MTMVETLTRTVDSLVEFAQAGHDLAEVIGRLADTFCQIGMYDQGAGAKDER